MIAEVDNYVYPAVDKILDEAFKKPEEQDAAQDRGRAESRDGGARAVHARHPRARTSPDRYPRPTTRSIRTSRSCFASSRSGIPQLRAAELLTPELDGLEGSESRRFRTSPGPIRPTGRNREDARPMKLSTTAFVDAAAIPPRLRVLQARSRHRT